MQSGSTSTSGRFVLGSSPALMRFQGTLGCLASQGSVPIKDARGRNHSSPPIISSRPCLAVPMAASAAVNMETGLLAFDMEQGALAKWCTKDADRSPPTAVLVHGILGSKRNLKAFTQMLLQEHPAWQVLLIDLRSHGDSAKHTIAGSGTASVDSAALDILRLLRHLRLFPTMLVGHSFGGKVVLSMIEQFGPNLPKPVTAWVLDTVPGRVQAGFLADGRIVDHPRDLIRNLRAMPTPIPSRHYVVDALQRAGFSGPVAKWVATNLRPADNRGGGGKLSWSFDLDGIADMYESYEAKSHWELLERPPKGLHVHFVRAENSSFRWQGDEATRIQRLGHSVHLLSNAGHWVHTDNPQGLLDIMRLAFRHRDDVRSIHELYASSLDA